jgi:uncharacterized protein (DUF885 family)
VSQTSTQLFKELQQQYYKAWFRFHPEDAVEVGVTDYASELRSYADDDIGALIALNQKLVSALDEINLDDLDESACIDYRILRGAVGVELHDLEERDWRFRNPADFVPLNAVYQLLVYPVEDVHHAIKHRLSMFPEYLRGAKVLLSQSAEQVVPVWLESAVSQCESGANFIRNLSRYPLITQKFTNPARLQPLFDDAAHALEDFSRFLQTEIKPRAAGDFSCGEFRFNRLLNEKHFLQTTAQDVLALGEKLFKETQQALLEHTKAMQGDEDVEALLQKIQKRHPKREHLLDTYRKRMRDAFKWWADSGLVSMPEKQALKVQETPEFMQHLIPFAAYLHPMPGDPEQHGTYFVTPVSDDAQLAEHNDFSIDLTCAHEAFPGHHLQFVTENQQHSSNHTRLVNASASMYEGWALYCEQLSIEQGWLKKDEYRFMMLRDRLWRALRIIIDVKLQTGQLSIERAIELMMAELGFERKQAEAEINWYTSSPTVPLCYATGCELIHRARDEVVSDTGLSLLEFHNKLLSQGSIALPLGLQHSFGEKTWQSIHADVFGKQ